MPSARRLRWVAFGIAGIAIGVASGIAGAVLTSGFYDLGSEPSVWAAYYGDDVSQYAERSSLRALASAELPLLINDAGFDPPSFQAQTQALVRARREAGTPTRYVHLAGHSHLSETYAVGTTDTGLSDAVREFIAAREE